MDLGLGSNKGMMHKRKNIHKLTLKFKNFETVNRMKEKLQTGRKCLQITYLTRDLYLKYINFKPKLTKKKQSQKKIGKEHEETSHQGEYINGKLSNVHHR